MLQIVLKNYGYYPFKIDGKFGPVSKKALINFQENNKSLNSPKLLQELKNLEKEQFQKNKKLLKRQLNLKIVMVIP